MTLRFECHSTDMIYQEGLSCGPYRLIEFLEWTDKNFQYCYGVGVCVNWKSGGDFEGRLGTSRFYYLFEAVGGESVS